MGFESEQEKLACNDVQQDAVYEKCTTLGRSDNEQQNHIKQTLTHFEDDQEEFHHTTRNLSFDLDEQLCLRQEQQSDSFFAESASASEHHVVQHGTSQDSSFEEAADLISNRERLSPSQTLRKNSHNHHNDLNFKEQFPFSRSNNNTPHQTHTKLDSEQNETSRCRVNLENSMNNFSKSEEGHVANLEREPASEILLQYAKSSESHSDNKYAANIVKESELQNFQYRLRKDTPEVEKSNMATPAKYLCKMLPKAEMEYINSLPEKLAGSKGNRKRKGLFGNLKMDNVKRLCHVLEPRYKPELSRKLRNVSRLLYNNSLPTQTDLDDAMDSGDDLDCTK